MSLVRFDIGNELDDLRREVNRIFAGFPLGQPMLGNGYGRWLPAMDTVERDGELCISIDVPGMHESDLDVEVTDNVLCIRGKRDIKREEQQQRWYRYERSSGRFERTLQMADNIDPEQVHATFDRGVLTVTLPTGKPAERSGKHIQITSTAGS